MAPKRLVGRYKRLNLEVLQERRFLRFCEVSYIPVQDDLLDKATPALVRAGDRKWEMVQRNSHQVLPETSLKGLVSFALDGVEICAYLRRSGKTFLILVAQYRPPVDAVVLEFPAGLVDQGEPLKFAALRELKEETGYTATEEDIISVTDVLCYEPGLTDSCCQLVKLFVDGDKDVNQSPVQQLDENEDIEVILLPICFEKSDGSDETPLELLCKILQEKNKKQRTMVDAKLYTYLDAFSLARTIHC